MIVLTALCSLRVSAVRAYPHPRTIRQADGTSITIVGHGDEFQHYVTTTDGYTVVKGPDGIYRYAVLSDGRLKASAVKASDAAHRASYENTFLSGIAKNLRPAQTATGEKLKKLASRTNAPLHRYSRRQDLRKSASATSSEPSTYRGLVILVNFTDRKFSRGNRSRQLVDDMMNKPDYTSYVDPLLNGRFTCTGSVRDYFFDNSDGKFITEFDVVGPVEIDVDQYYINGIDRTYELCKKVLETADPEIDYSRYDYDGDGEVDMLYLLYAGYAAIYQGNDERLLWPHAGYFGDSDISVKLDGMRFGRFACSTEIYGWKDYGDMYLDGIGVIVHEFSHVLGFKDHYDVSGYLNEDPGAWDVMSAGNYNGICNDTPCGYNSYEKYAAGFISPRTVTSENDGESILLRPLSSSTDALRIKSMQDSVVYMIENRQLEKWDSELPGHGMLVWRVDSCDNEYWVHNALNVNGRLHFKLIRANGATRTLFQEIEDKDYDPFPGTRNIYELTNYGTQSHLRTELNYPSPLALRNIKEDCGIISFILEEDPEAQDKPFTFTLNERYTATGIRVEDDEECEWTVRTGTVQLGGRERMMIYDLVPDTKGIAASNPGYAGGLGATFSVTSDNSRVYIEPYRVALLEDFGIWLVDFNDLDNGGSGAIVLNMNPYGDISLANPESVIGYCSLPKTSPLVIKENIMERFSEVRNIHFGFSSGIDMLPESELSMPSDIIYNLQGIRVTKPRKGDLYIVGGKKVRF